MTRGRSLLCLVTGALLLVAQLHVWTASGCSMCGTSCRCTSHLAGDSCSLRSVGCGGGNTGSAPGSVSPLRAVLAEALVVATRPAQGRPPTLASHVPPQPPRPPLDHPPRLSC